MLALLRPNLTTPIVLVSAAIWCAGAVAYVIVGPTHKPAPVALAADPPPAPERMLIAIDDIARANAAASKSDRLPITVPAPPSGTDTPAPVPAVPAAPAPAPRIEDPPPVTRTIRHATADDSDDRHGRDSDICQRHHMHKENFYKGHHRYWRCKH
jgi:hypothetical protein